MAALVLLGGCAQGGPASLAIAEKFNRWTSYEGDAGATHYSALKQIDRSNVRQLQVAWSYPIGDNSSYGFNPVVIDSMMYVLGKGSSVVAIHAANGREIWSQPLSDNNGTITNRGIMYWESPDRSDRRVLTSKGNNLYAIDASTGRLVPFFGAGGKVDLREGYGVDPKLIGRGQSPSPGRVFENLVILGTATGEEYGAVPGDIRAFDARTGRLVWSFHTIPRPGEFGYESWPADAWQRTGKDRIGGVNAWGGLSVDEERGIVYVPLGSASYDFYGADRLGANLFANSLVALDARTGKRIWHFQTTHHDLWDYDLVTTPTLLTVRHEGKMVDAVAQASKQGFLFVFDRVTGEPLWPIEERPVPKSDMPGEVAWPTQPFPTWPKPFAIQSFTEEDVNPHITDPAERDSVLRTVRSAVNQGLYTPPSTRPTMQMPGNSGGSNWGTSAADPSEGSVFVMAKNLPTVLKLERIIPGVFGTGTSQADRGQFAFQQNCQICHLATRQGQPPLIPSLVGVTSRLSPEQIRTVVKEGRGNMPAFRDLPDPAVNAIITYLTSPDLASPPVQSGGAGAVGPLSAQAAGAMGPLSAQAAGEDGPLRFQTGYGYFSASGGMWARKPPYTTLTKYDLNTGEIRWQIPVGEVESLTARGITGTGAAQLRGGPAVTAGGLVFVITGDKLRAYDKDDGKELWAGQLPVPGDGIPAVYEVGGRQYVVVSAAAGAAAPPGAPPRKQYVAFALPRR
jgi:quinoprotein glucose dehydrogenase